MAGFTMPLSGFQGPRRVTPPGNSDSSASGREEKLHRACQEFESLLLTQMLKGMRESAAALGEPHEETGAGLMSELMDEHLARALAKAGGLGLGRMLEAKLHARSGGETDAPARVFSPPAAGLGMTRWIPVERPAGEAPRRVARYDPIIARAAGSFNLSPGLLRAVITQESGGKADAVSPKGAKGLMQLMDETARDLGVADPYDPEQNIFGGARYLRQLLNRWRGDLKKALAAYNAGPAAVERHGGVPPYRETRDYVRRVMELMQVSAHANGTAKDRS